MLERKKAEAAERSAEDGRIAAYLTEKAEQEQVMSCPHMQAVELSSFGA